MFLEYFGLQDDPFGVTPEPRYLFQSSTHREALASLKFGFYSNRGFTTLIAPPGLGKTTLLHRFLGDIGDSARSVFLFDLDGQCEPRDLIRSILRDLGMNPAESSTAMHDQLKGVLLQEARRSRVVVIVIDEAQNLSEAALETVRLLSNFETTRAKLIHIVLAGQPQLSDKLLQPSLVQLRQRVTTICRIKPLSAEETRAYIDHRLQLAGYSGAPLFSGEALNLIVEACQGIPRMINNLCFNTLSICRAMNQKQVAAGMVEEAIADTQLIPHTLISPTPIQHIQELAAALTPPPFEVITHAVPPAREVVEAPASPVEMFQGASNSPATASTTTESAATESAATGMTATGSHRPWKIAAAVLSLLMLTAGYSGFRLLQNHDVSANTKPAATTVPASKRPGLENVRIPQDAGSRIKPFQVRVELHQTLRDIAVQYLGEFNENRLRQIRALNPKLANPNHIRAGEKIWLPGTPALKVAPTAGNSTDARNVP